MSLPGRAIAAMTGAGAATPAKELASLADTTFSTGLIERPAAGFAPGVPEGAGDDGFFGPASVTWRMSADLASPVAGLRSLLLQALHPLAMAGVDQHSGWRRDPAGRLAATSAHLATVTFGDRAAAMRAAARVRRMRLIRVLAAVVAAAAALVRTLVLPGRRAGRLRRGRARAAVRLAVRGGARYAAGTPRLFAVAGAQRALLREDLAPRTAGDVAGTLGAMKGVLMKIGQMASYIGDGLSPAVRQILARLQDSVPPMRPRLAAGVVEEELGAPPDRAFARWDPRPVAAASTGPVHRAVTLDGRAVAVKVQYPGIAETIAADLRDVALLRRMLRLAAPAQDTGALISEPPVVRRFFDPRSPVAGYIAVPRPYVILQRINPGPFACPASCPPPPTAAPSPRKHGPSPTAPPPPRWERPRPHGRHGTRP